MQQEAAFLLWHHALQDEATAIDVGSNGALLACINLLDSTGTSKVEKCCCAGLLHALAKVDDHCQAIAQTKTISGNASIKVLLACFGFEQSENLMCHVAGTLVHLVQNPGSRAHLLKSLDQGVKWGELGELIVGCKREKLRASVAEFLAGVLRVMENLQELAGDAGLVGITVQALSISKTDAALSALVRCLTSMMDHKKNVDRALDHGAVNLLVDLLGPPPQHIINRGQILCGTTAAGSQTPSSAKSCEPESIKDVRQNSYSSQAMEECRKNAISTDSMLSCTSLKASWRAMLTLQPQALAAACLYKMVENEECYNAMDKRMATYRLVKILLRVMKDSLNDGGKKSKKSSKKGIKLDAEQEEAVISASGCLKFLSTTNCNRHRIARMGILPLIKELYTNSDRLLLRRNSQVLLINIAMLSENAAYLSEAGIGEEFQVPVPMTLTAEEKMEIEEEFGLFDSQKEDHNEAAKREQP